MDFALHSRPNRDYTIVRNLNTAQLVININFGNFLKYSFGENSVKYLFIFESVVLYFNYSIVSSGLYFVPNTHTEKVWMKQHLWKVWSDKKFDLSNSHASLHACSQPSSIYFFSIGLSVPVVTYSPCSSVSPFISVYHSCRYTNTNPVRIYFIHPK